MTERKPRAQHEPAWVADYLRRENPDATGVLPRCRWFRRRADARVFG